MVTRIVKLFKANWQAVFTQHCVKRMFERNILEEEVTDILSNARHVEIYPDEEPFPERLVCGYSGYRCLHVVFAGDEQNKIIYVITVYEPNPDEWEEGCLRKKQ